MRTCVYEGECQTQAAACSAVGQACFDPNVDVANDWQCLCVYPLKGIAATGGIAQCVLDECAAGTSGQSICAAAGQVCTDSQPYANSTNDWTCNCVNPPSSMLTRPAECNWQNECVNNHKVCTDAGQTCTDDTSNIMGDWKCECVSPSSGSAIAQKAQCDVNECTTQTVCTDVGQICNDPDLKTSGDWRCSCQGDSKGSALRKPAQCGYTTTACEKNHAVCESNGQFCETKNNIEFTCKCLPPLLGSQVGAPAGCYEPFGDECAADRPNAKVCTDQGQQCVDPNQDVSADWECRCTNGANKKARRAPVPSCDDSTPAPVVVSSLKVCVQALESHCTATIPLHTVRVRHDEDGLQRGRDQERSGQHLQGRRPDHHRHSDHHRKQGGSLCQWIVVDAHPAAGGAVPFAGMSNTQHDAPSISSHATTA